ncbi:MAG: response regulator [Myxococcales bacterium]
MAVQASEVVSFPSTVLVVDDEPVVLEVFEALVPQAGMDVRLAATAEDALVVLRQTAVGCLLTDKNLPGMDGLALMKQTRALQPWCACILMTGYASTASAVEALRLGAADYLEKPFQDLDLVLEKIGHALKTERLAWEKAALLNRLHAFEAELRDRDHTVNRQQTEIELFNSILEERVKQATNDLLRHVRVLEESLRGNCSLDAALALHTESILEYLRGVQLEDGRARGVLARVGRQLESNLELIRAGLASRAS